MIKLCVFDFDSTLMDGETIDFLSRCVGKEKEVSDITKRAMRGELDFYESLVLRVSYLEGLELNTALEIANNLPFIQGAKEIISHLKSKDIKVAVFSGGFHIATDLAQEKLRFDINFANELHHKNNLLTGKVGGEMMFGDSKGKMLKRLKNLLSLEANQVAVVGDGANDLSMFQEASIKVAFCAKDILKKSATHIIDEKNLLELTKIKDFYV